MLSKIRHTESSVSPVNIYMYMNNSSTLYRWCYVNHLIKISCHAKSIDGWMSCDFTSVLTANSV